MYVSLSISSILAKALKIIHLLVTMLAAGSTGFWPRCSTVPFHVKRVGQHRLLPGTVFIINTILHRRGGVCGPHPPSFTMLEENKTEKRGLCLLLSIFFPFHRSFLVSTSRLMLKVLWRIYMKLKLWGEVSYWADRQIRTKLTSYS